MADARDHVTREVEKLARQDRVRAAQQADDEMARQMIGEMRPDIEAIEKAIPRKLYIRKRFTYEPASYA
jgi:hypothetical protein